MNDQDAIRKLIDDRVTAMRNRNGRAAVAGLARDIVAFEVAGPLTAPAAQVTDAVATQAWLNSFDGPIDVDIAELAIHVSGDVGFAHSIHTLRGTHKDGTTLDLRMRSTLGFRKLDDQWKIVHAHTSVPR